MSDSTIHAYPLSSFIYSILSEDALSQSCLWFSVFLNLFNIHSHALACFFTWNETKKGNLLLSLSSLFHLPTFFLSYISFCVYILFLLCLSIQGNEIGKEFFIINIAVVVSALYCIQPVFSFIHSMLEVKYRQKIWKRFQWSLWKKFSFFLYNPSYGALRNIPRCEINILLIFTFCVRYQCECLWIYSANFYFSFWIKPEIIWFEIKRTRHFKF